MPQEVRTHFTESMNSFSLHAQKGLQRFPCCFIPGCTLWKCKYVIKCVHICKTAFLPIPSTCRYLTHGMSYISGTLDL